MEKNQEILDDWERDLSPRERVEMEHKSIRALCARERHLSPELGEEWIQAGLSLAQVRRRASDIQEATNDQQPFRLNGLNFRSHISAEYIDQDWQPLLVQKN